MFKKIKGRHLDGRKDMSTSLPILDVLDPDFVYFPLNTGNVVYTKCVEIGDKVKMGQTILNREGRFGHPVASSVSGTVNGIKKMWHSSGKMVEMLEIANDHLETKAYDEKAFNDPTKDEIISLVQAAGIVGLGGAGFPTYVKYMPTQAAEVCIINAAECEPYITADYMRILSEADKLVAGLHYIMKANDATKGVIAIKKSKKQAIETLNKALVGVSDITVFELNDVYPAGWEKYIVEKVTKKNYQMLPREVGAVVNNVQTCLAVYDAIALNKPLIEKVVTVTGEGLNSPRNFRVKIGTRVQTLIPLCGGYVDDLDDAYFIAGGPMTGKAILFDDLVITSNVGSVIIKPKKTQKALPCIGCGKCAENCPAFLTPTAIKAAADQKDINLLASLNVNRCVQCGLCSYVCPSRVEMTDFMAKAKDMYIKASVNLKGKK